MGNTFALSHSRSSCARSRGAGRHATRRSPRSIPAGQRSARLGGYDILAQIGAGGMGDVYQAKDTRLKRDVALKVLPDSVAHDTDRLARFQREAKLLATLSHPNIAAIYGLEDATGVRALVLELPGSYQH